MSDGPDGAALLRGERRFGFKERRQKPAQHLHDGGGARAGGHELGLAGQPLAELVHQPQGVLGALMGQMEIDHGGGDLLDGRAAFGWCADARRLPADGWRNVTQRMDRSGRDVELFAGEDQKPLQGGAGHAAKWPDACARPGLGGCCRRGRRWERSGADAVEGPVAAQFLVQRGGQRDDAILVAFAVADEELVLGPGDVVNGQGQAFAQAQAATVDELDGSAITAQADVAQQIMTCWRVSTAGRRS